MALSVAACGGLGPYTAASRTVELDGSRYRVEQMTASTWTATPPESAPDASRSAHLVKAIEKASGCKVTDSSFGQPGAAFSAQVDCGSKISH